MHLWSFAFEMPRNKRLKRVLEARGVMSVQLRGSRHNSNLTSSVNLMRGDSFNHLWKRTFTQKCDL